MKTYQKVITNSLIVDNLLINFPLWFPLTYIFLILNFPSYGKLIFLASLFIFAETHFASTWLFFFDSENWQWLKENSYKIIFIPVYTLFLITIVWQYSPLVIIIIHYLASGWHVTKQSVGIINIYGNKSKIYQFLIYFASFTCLVVGLNKPGLLSGVINLNILNFSICLFIIFYGLLIALNFKKLLSKDIQLLMPLITGIFIYLPILFFDDLATATAVGVGMHWCQYLAIVWSKHFRKKNFNEISKNKKNQTWKYILFVMVYALTMSVLTVNGIVNRNNLTIQYNFFYLIPLSFQLYHFYIDGFIWKFSDPKIKQSILPFMFANNK